MADEQKTPVAIRITRPYATEQEYLEREFDTLTRTSVTLLGAQPRPQGVVLRFEIVLANGDSLIRGEGRVVGFKEKAYGGEAGLTLRFTRLDARSKTLLDQAATLREARVRAAASGMPAVVPKAADSAPGPSASFLDPARPPPPPPRRPPPPLPMHARSQVPPPPPSSSVEIEIESTQVDSTFHDPRPGRLEEPVAERLDEPLAAVPSPLPPPPRVEPSHVEPLHVAQEAAPSLPRPSGFPPSRPRVSTRPPPLPPMPPRSGSSKPPPVPPSPPRISVPPPAAVAAPAFVPPIAAVASNAPFTPPARPQATPSASASPRIAASDRTVTPPADREALLRRLRTRAQSLPHSRVSEILTPRAAR